MSYRQMRSTVEVRAVDQSCVHVPRRQRSIGGQAAECVPQQWIVHFGMRRLTEPMIPFGDRERSKCLVNITE